LLGTKGYAVAVAVAVAVVALIEIASQSVTL
jgi:hypothetical protein